MMPYNTPIRQNYLHEQLRFLRKGQNGIYVSDRLWLRFHKKDTIEITVFELSGKMRTKWGITPDTIGKLIDYIKEMNWDMPHYIPKDKSKKPMALVDAIPSYEWMERPDYKKENRSLVLSEIQKLKKP
jgi:hypothetical protein